MYEVFTEIVLVLTNFLKELLSDVDQLCANSFSNLPEKLKKLENDGIKLQSEIIEEGEESSRLSLKLDSILSKLPSEYKNKSMSELLTILQQLQNDLTGAQIFLQSSEVDRLETIINSQFQKS